MEVNEQRVRVGDIGEIELMQSQVDRDQFKAGVISAQADVYSADLALAQQLGQPEKLSAGCPCQPDAWRSPPAFSILISWWPARSRNGLMSFRGSVLSRLRSYVSSWRKRI